MSERRPEWYDAIKPFLQQRLNPEPLRACGDRDEFTLTIDGPEEFEADVTHWLNVPVQDSTLLERDGMEVFIVCNLLGVVRERRKDGWHLIATFEVYDE
jgi:hypothetical protein